MGFYGHIIYIHCDVVGWVLASAGIGGLGLVSWEIAGIRMRMGWALLLFLGLLGLLCLPDLNLVGRYGGGCDGMVLFIRGVFLCT